MDILIVLPLLSFGAAGVTFVLGVLAFLGAWFSPHTRVFLAVEAVVIGGVNLICVLSGLVSIPGNLNFPHFVATALGIIFAIRALVRDRKKNDGKSPA